MKAFLLGLAGMFTALVIAAIVLPLYADYSDRAITSEMIAAVIPVKTLIEKNLPNQPSPTALEQSLVEVRKHAVIRRIVVYEGKVILVQGGRAGQILTFTPLIEKSGITWVCEGGSYKTVPVSCRHP